SNRNEPRENESKVTNPNTPLPVKPPSDVPVSIPGTLSAQGQGQKPTSGNTKTLSSGIESLRFKAPTNTSPTQPPPPPSTVQKLLHNIPLRSPESSSLPTERHTAAQSTLSKLESTSPLSLSQGGSSNRNEPRENESKVTNPNTPLPVKPPSDVPVSIPGTLSAQGQG
ncbi:unnamed protein product, partial [Adineta steineri]